MHKDQDGNGKGSGFVCFKNFDDAERALNDMNEKKLFYVAKAIPKEERKRDVIK